jgi:hypothetical protein
MEPSARWIALAAGILVLATCLPGLAVAATPLSTIAVHPSGALLRAGPTPATATNWAGYVAENTTGSINFSVTKISAKWVQPAVNCSNLLTAIVVIWVGIDGASSNTVEQDGSYAQCVAGTASYSLWWELYPKNSIQTISTITVKAGDTITGSVVYSSVSGKYAMKVADGTHSFTKVGTQTGTLRSSAECIVERPSGGSGLFDLANFGSATFSTCTATINGHSGGIGSFPNVFNVTMLGNNGVTVIATTSSLTANRSFSVTWKGYS